MCLIVLAWQADTRYPLVVAANRDEELSRATTPAAFWPSHPYVLAGRDLSAGGTWMGTTLNGRFAAITNFRDPARLRDDAPSRGKLVSDFLQGDRSPAEYIADISSSSASCNGFNLLVADQESLWWYSNVSGESRALSPGIYGISNHLLDTPWPKLVTAKARFAEFLKGLPDTNPFFRLLRDEQQYPDEALPSTGVSLERERWLSAIYVKTPTYCTRSSTVMCRNATGETSFDEQTWLVDGQVGERVSFHFNLEAPLEHR